MAADKTARRFVVTLGFIVGGLIVALALNTLILVQLRDTQRIDRKVTSQTNRLVQTEVGVQGFLADCNTPGPNPPPSTGHKCFDDATVRSSVLLSDAVRAADQVQIVVAECARATGTEKELDSCVHQRIAPTAAP